MIKDNKLNGFGQTDTKNHKIRINVSKNKSTRVKGELGDSILHEAMHATYPRLSEKSIIEKTKRAWSKMSPNNKSKLYKLLK